MNDAVRIVDGLRDGLMDAAGQQAVARRLAVDPELRAAVGDEWRLQRRLAALYADDEAGALWQRIGDGLKAGSSVSGAQRTFAAVERRLATRRQPRRRALRPGGWPMLAALAAAAALVVVLLVGRDGAGARSTPTPTPALRVATVQGEVRVVRAEGLFAARPGMALCPADRIETLAGAATSLELDDGSRLDLAAAANMGWDGDARFHLDQGLVAVSARPRPVASPLAITTPQAVATVVGTRFRLEHRDRRTVLRVAEGTVRFERNDASALLVHAGQEASAPLAMVVTPAAAATGTTAASDPGAAGPQVVAFRFVEAASGRPLPGWERVTTDAVIAAAALPAGGWTVIALTAPERVPAVQFRLDGVATGVIQTMPPYALTPSRSADGTSRFLPWGTTPGTHRLEAVLCRSRTDTASVGQALAITLTITSAETNDETPRTR
jgi:ferric-dicitrate binding protein FerR (iron transport regulator)